MKRLMVFVLIFVAAPINAKAPKVDQRNGRQDEAHQRCIEYTRDNAKNPDSFKAEEKYEFKLANWATAYRAGKSQIIIWFDGRGMNVYGAVLRHNFTCWASCPPNKPCVVDGEEDNPY